MINYNNKKFRVVETSDNGEVNHEMIFHYKQEGNILSCSYHSGTIIKGNLLGIVDHKGNINMRYHQINQKGEITTGKCLSTPKQLTSGKIRLYESWQWTSGDLSHGKSILEEV